MACGKKWYQTRSIAKHERKRLNVLARARWGHTDKLTAEYYCDECNGWHITHMPKNVSRKLNLKNKKV